MGDPSMLTEEMISNANEIWQLKMKSCHIAQKRKALKTDLEVPPIALSQCDTMHVSSSELFASPTEEASPQQLSTSSVIDHEDSPSAGMLDEVGFAWPDAEADEADPEKDTIDLALPAAPLPAAVVKPKSSVSKKLAYVLLERIAEYLFSLCRTNRMPYWDKVKDNVTSMAHQFYINPTVNPTD